MTGVPDDLLFATKPALAAAMLTKAVADGIRAAFFAADEVYGSRELRSTCRTLGLGYAIAVRSNHRITTPGGAMTCNKEALKLIPGQGWQRMRTGTGSKGARDYDRSTRHHLHSSGALRSGCACRAPQLPGSAPCFRCRCVAAGRHRNATGRMARAGGSENWRDGLWTSSMLWCWGRGRRGRTWRTVCARTG
ncbi:transposase [Streptacidiphilus sp. MAP12-16]|uniref:transposase n=1 Tax=Streptacidiphilus sp. MAP12-16 TaxID=3156300 RepID=UPI003512FD3A